MLNFQTYGRIIVLSMDPDLDSTSNLRFRYVKRNPDLQHCRYRYLLQLRRFLILSACACSILILFRINFLRVLPTRTVLSVADPDPAGSRLNRPFLFLKATWAQCSIYKLAEESLYYLRNRIRIQLQCSDPDPLKMYPDP